ncbi:hypothetical protein AAV96_09555 [Acinetobacter sp. AG1]|uniref:hypothetical protein n=1 Tax=Acinetobacter sp. AG1 TaxID=348388 RepID=UPI000629290D|nr:hypothetical protein [Acinetobacter sp. AG1]KKW78851.1 hypothetical protein AAV96_09555 [Acinetobacter sp. AG1]
MTDVKKRLEDQKMNFLNTKHLDWYADTYIRNYVEFLEFDYQEALALAKDNFQNDLSYLTTYIAELNSAYASAKEYLEISYEEHIYEN